MYWIYLDSEKVADYPYRDDAVDAMYDLIEDEGEVITDKSRGWSGQLTLWTRKPCGEEHEWAVLER